MTPGENCSSAASEAGAGDDLDAKLFGGRFLSALVSHARSNVDKNRRASRRGEKEKEESAGERDERSGR